MTVAEFSSKDWAAYPGAECWATGHVPWVDRTTWGKRSNAIPVCVIGEPNGVQVHFISPMKVRWWYLNYSPITPRICRALVEEVVAACSRDDDRTIFEVMEAELGMRRRDWGEELAPIQKPAAFTPAPAGG